MVLLCQMFFPGLRPRACIIQLHLSPPLYAPTLNLFQPYLPPDPSPEISDRILPQNLSSSSLSFLTMLFPQIPRVLHGSVSLHFFSPPFSQPPFCFCQTSDRPSLNTKQNKQHSPQPRAPDLLCSTLFTYVASTITSDSNILSFSLVQCL